MLDNRRSPSEIYAQLKAVEKGVHEAIYNVFDGQLKKHFADVLAERLALCPGDCDDAERLQFLKSEFGKFDLKVLIDELAWLRTSLATVKPVQIELRKEVKKQ